ncbi:uncharacterized protein LOC112093643 [Morus notabilis]|uniref:uncharacterized protein LOC112093643 n=1 Tax=Morus notabilis TaxID=981085 RepID=UPI000CED2A22|nr:uncharacterized protein LOC112093643 [Morus notabilis]
MLFRLVGAELLDQNPISRKLRIMLSMRIILKLEKKVEDSIKKNQKDGSDVGIDSKSLFYSDSNKNMWTFVIRRNIHSERLLKMSEFEELGVIQLLKSQNLFGTVSKAKPFVRNIVFEFYANLVSDIAKPESEMFHKVFVRGHIFHFSAEVINDFYGSHREAVQCEVDFDAVISELTAKVQCLHTTSVHKPLAKLLFLVNSSTTFDIGQLIFDEIVSNVEACTTHQVLPFPSLICEVLLSQKNIKKEDEVSDKLSGVLRISKKLRTWRHVDDIQGEFSSAEEDDVPSSSVGVATSSDKQRMIHFLQQELRDLTASEDRFSEKEGCGCIHYSLESCSLPPTLLQQLLQEILLHELWGVNFCILLWIWQAVIRIGMFLSIEEGRHFGDAVNVEEN